MSLRDCERCGESEFVKEFYFFSSDDLSGSEWLCWDCRWPYIEGRVFPERYEDEPEADEQEVSGQASLGDF